MNKEIVNRIVLIGTGSVGCRYAYSMINQGVAEELVLIDVNEAKSEGEAMDLNHGMPFRTFTNKGMERFLSRL
jgi:L-lactate dehydrogenase